MSRKKKTLSRRERQAAEFESRQVRLKKARTVVGFLAIVPILGSLLCDLGFGFFCVDFSYYMALWAAIFGAFVGLTIRLVRERRRFDAQQPRAS